MTTTGVISLPMRILIGLLQLFYRYLQTRSVSYLNQLLAFLRRTHIQWSNFKIIRLLSHVTTLLLYPHTHVIIWIIYNTKFNRGLWFSWPWNLQILNAQLAVLVKTCTNGVMYLIGCWSGEPVIENIITRLLQ